MATFHSGKTGTGTVNGVEVALTDWAVDPSATIVQFINSKTGNYPKREATFRDLTGNFGIDVDFDSNIFATPISILPGTTVTNIKLILTGGTGGTLYWSIASAVIQGTPQSLSVDGKIITRVNFATDGPVTAPGGATP
jgi:hypothetical protein